LFGGGRQRLCRPIVRRYIGEIGDHIRSDGFAGSFLIVQSTGGSI
jgi:N-methylhydantoinase A/oxoprolinase/acetone carboxylase beta subunit